MTNTTQILKTVTNLIFITTLTLLLVVVVAVMLTLQIKDRTNQLEKKMDTLITMYTNQQDQKVPGETNPAGTSVYNITAYTARREETNKDNENTATMERPMAGRTCAVSRDLINWLGGWVYIEGVGVRKVNDLMNSRYTKSIDLCVRNPRIAKRFGRNRVRTVFLGR